LSAHRGDLTLKLDAVGWLDDGARAIKQSLRAPSSRAARAGCPWRWLPPARQLATPV
jgi:hypothetical protein